MLMFGQIHIPLSLLAVAALLVGLTGMALRRGIAEPRESNGYLALAGVGAAGLVLRIAGIVPGWSIPRT